ncbi:MAG: hypothetical protein JJT75_02680 [Opitutales bacterium]|nr:hypothetical protein [Opitutales bacterium]MCH8539831.1 hypothetical protein [Opitutales bacterium]
MKQTTDPTQEPKPEKLLAGFSRTRLDFWIVVALVVHVAILAGTSVPYLYDTWIDPEGAEERRAAVEEDDSEEAEAVREAIEQGSEAREEEATEAEEEPAEEPAEEELTPVERRVQEAADPEEIPTDPDDLGISLEETNR